MKIALPSIIGLTTSKLSPFHDDIIYNLDFVGEKADFNVPGIKYDENDFVIMRTPHNEEYKCYLPQDTVDKDEDIEEVGESAEVLLDTLFKVGANNKPQCSFKLETYWSYEVCHGKYIRQYHDEKIKGGTKTTEYFLGYFNQKLPMVTPEDSPKTRAQVSKRIIDGIETPYWEVVMDQGTPCSLKAGQNRITRLQYICNQNAVHNDILSNSIHNEILSITETKTCEYEIQILTSALCKSPLYAQKHDTDMFGIPCEKIGEKTPTVPIGYNQLQKELDLSSLMSGSGIDLGNGAQLSITTIDTKTGEIKQISQEELAKLLTEQAKKEGEGNTGDGNISPQDLQKILDNIPENGDLQQIQDHIAKAIMKEVKKTGVDIKNVQMAKQETEQKKTESAKVESALKRPSSVLDAETKKILHSFLQGEYCLRGGTGWWKYEFCYGKHVLQYHEWPVEVGKPRRERDEIFVGKWNSEDHIEYAKTKKVVTRQTNKKTKMTEKPEAKQSFDESGEPLSVWNPDETDDGDQEGDRVVGVELYYTNGDICDLTSKPRDVIVRLKCKPGASALSLYLLEPKPCSYILGLESQLLCQLLSDVDDNGLIQL